MTQSPKFADDPTATYRGYRRQALYCLFKLFDDGLPNNSVVQPEGNEDLEIRNIANEPIEVAQVKDYSADLTVSAFKPSFYRRISQLCRSNPSVGINIVSFGPIGRELRKACDNNQETPKRALNTLTKDREEVRANGEKQTIPGITEGEANELFTRVNLIEVEETALANHVIEQLRATMTSGDPHVAFENLMWWLISSAENQLKLTRALTIEKISQLGRFITHRAAHEHEWHISIKPIQSSSSNDEDREKLRREFFQAGRVRADHVSEGFDVPRNDALDRIHKAFRNENVVILRAASGQGKTTLAYRYLLDWAPADFRYQVEQAADLQHSRRMAAAIAGHKEVIDVPTIVYIDVRPGDSLWVEVVRELSGVKDIQVLVTIREDDWFRSRVTKDDFLFVDLSIPFTEETGERIFTELRAIGLGDDKLDFHDAWSQLGERKTLFEFVYLTTQNEQLAEKIRAQINTLKDEVNAEKLLPKELQLLRLVAVASAYEARLDLKDLVEFLEIPEPARTLERFHNEFLLRTTSDGRSVEGFHAIRSEIIAVELTDAVIQPRGEIEAAIPTLLVEEDIESFLLCSFSRNESSAEMLIDGLYRTKFKTWVGVRGVLVALQWIGLKKYADNNADLIDEVRLISPTAWWFTLDWDLAQVRGQAGFDSLESLAENSKEFARAAEVASDFQNRQSEKDEVFTFATPWLQLFGLPTNVVDSANQFIAMGEVLYWLGHLQITNEEVTSWLDEGVISEAFTALPIHMFSRFATGVQQSHQNIYIDWLRKNRTEVESVLRNRTSIFALIEEDDCLVAHYVIDIDRNASALQLSEEEVSINDLSVQRVEVVSACLPGFARYGAAGYGHRMSFFDGVNDDSTKRMPIENIPMPWLPQFNSLARGVAEYRLRPDSWDDFFTQVRELREKVIAAFRELRTAISKVHKNQSTPLLDTEAWDECKKIVNGDFFLPKTAVDEWGFVTESQSQMSSEPKAKKFSAISTLDPFKKSVSEYTRTIANFMNQSLQALVLIPSLRSATTDSNREAVIEKGKSLGVTESSIRLSVVNGMDACSAVKQMHRVERSLLQCNRSGVDEPFRVAELQEFITTMRSWSLFCYREQVIPKPPMHPKGKKRKKTPLKKIAFRDSLKPTRNRVKDALNKLKTDGIIGKIVSEEILWDEESTLWITFDTSDPLESLVAIEKIWFALIEAFRPDREKIVRIKVINWFWKKIVLIPLVKGRSLEQQAFSQMDAVSYPLNEEPELQPWRFIPEPIPDKAWNELGLLDWERQKSWDKFDEFATAYGLLFHHVDHMTDLSRCKIEVDDLGEEISQSYLRIEEKRLQPIMQATIDTYGALLASLPELDEEISTSRPNLMECIDLISAMKESVFPSEDGDEYELSLNAIADWRNRMKDGFNLLGVARNLWIADSLGFDAFEVTE